MIAKKIEEAGVVGAGGAGFPTHVKAKSRAEVLIANGAECEPLLQCDAELMKFEPQAVIAGLKLMGEATGASELVVAVKEKNRDALKAVARALGAEEKIRIHELGNFYPAGDEVSLVYEVTGRIPPEGGLPLDVGVVVQNVGTLAKVAEAVEGRPFIRRFVTVSGEVAEPGTFDVPIGTSFMDLVKAAGGPAQEPFCIVVGGPCMGWAASSLDEAVSKTTTGILLLPPGHPLVQIKTANLDQLLHRAKSVCDQCRDCTDLCPRFLLGHNLEPHRLMTAIGWGASLGAPEMKTAHLCCECGICGLYACPMGLYPNLYIQRIKEELDAAGLPRERGRSVEQPHGDYQGRKVPTARLFARLGLNDYSDHAPFRPGAVDPSKVKILLKQHIGATSVPVVKAGGSVKAGDAIGEIPDGALGARIHASISGQVTEVTDQWVVIQAST